MFRELLGGLAESVTHTEYKRVTKLLEDGDIDNVGSEGESGDYVYIKVEDGRGVSQYLRGRDKNYLYHGIVDGVGRTKTQNKNLFDITKLN